MIHLRTYNESAGSIYRELSEDEIKEHMSENRPDTFTSGEVQTLLDIVKATNRPVEFVEWNFDMKDGLEFHSINSRRLRSHLFLFEPDGKTTRDIMFPRVPANNIIICDVGRKMQEYMYIFLLKSSDDWFYALMEIEDEPSWFICDGFNGLKSLIIDLFESRKS
jgi:hypothetical protein